jgi:transposase
LQVDGYAGYNRLIQPDRASPSIQLAYCWAYPRRKLIGVARNRTALIVENALKCIAELYEIEAEIGGLTP